MRIKQMDKYKLTLWLDYAFLTLEQKTEEKILELKTNQKETIEYQKELKEIEEAGKEIRNLINKFF